jgi:hypothetical protein
MNALSVLLLALLLAAQVRIKYAHCKCFVFDVKTI